eukprot:IDg11958t1
MLRLVSQRTVHCTRVAQIAVMRGGACGDVCAGACGWARKRGYAGRRCARRARAGGMAWYIQIRSVSYAHLKQRNHIFQKIHTVPSTVHIFTPTLRARDALTSDTPFSQPVRAATELRTTMWPLPLLRPLFAVTRDSLLAALRALPGARLLEPTTRLADGVPTFVMMPLDFALDTAWLSGDALEEALNSLVRAGVHGVMVDVWWGICEQEPEQYTFDRYLQLASQCRRLGLRMQATMCFHACGGNVGDTVNIAIPSWAAGSADAHHAWYADRAHDSRKDGEIDALLDRNRECISLGADHVRMLARKAQGAIADAAPLRTPLEAYGEFISAFCNELKDYLPDTISELQIGMGPC